MLWERGIRGGPGCATSYCSHCWHPATPEKTPGSQFPPTITCTVYREPRWWQGLKGRWLYPAESGSESQGWLELPAWWAGRSKSGVNNDEEWQKQKPCVFSQGDVFSPLSRAQAIWDVCMFSCQCLGHLTYSLVLSIRGRTQERQRLQQHHQQLTSF